MAGTPRALHPEYRQSSLLLVAASPLPALLLTLYPEARGRGRTEDLRAAGPSDPTADAHRHGSHTSQSEPCRHLHVSGSEYVLIINTNKGGIRHGRGKGWRAASSGQVQLLLHVEGKKPFQLKGTG